MIGKMHLIITAVSCMIVTSAFAGGLPGADENGSIEAEANALDAANDTSNTNGSPLHSGSSAGNEMPETSATSQSSGVANNDNSNDDEGFVAIEDDPLIVDATAIMDDDGMGEVSVQWQGIPSLDDPEVNITLGAYYLSKLFLRFGDLGLALEAYNHGPSRLKGYLKNGYRPKHYSQKVFRNYSSLMSNFYWQNWNEHPSPSI